MATTLRYGPSTARGGHGPTTACPAALCRGAARLGHLKTHSSPIVNRQAERVDSVSAPSVWPRKRFASLDQKAGRGKNTETLERSFKAPHASRVGEHLVHLRGRETLQGRDDVGVRVERQTDLRVSKGFHDRPRIDTLCEQKRCGGMS